MVCKALASLDVVAGFYKLLKRNFNPQGSREPRHLAVANPFPHVRFQSTRLSRASTIYPIPSPPLRKFQSTRLSRASTPSVGISCFNVIISIHKALASLDVAAASFWKMGMGFQSTRLSRASTESHIRQQQIRIISIHKALASLDVFKGLRFDKAASISIHKALASLDNGNRNEMSILRHFNPQGSREPRPSLLMLITYA